MASGFVTFADMSLADAEKVLTKTFEARRETRDDAFDFRGLPPGSLLLAGDANGVIVSANVEDVLDALDGESLEAVLSRWGVPARAARALTVMWSTVTESEEIEYRTKGKVVRVLSLRERRRVHTRGKVLSAEAKLAPDVGEYGVALAGALDLGPRTGFESRFTAFLPRLKPRNGTKALAEKARARSSSASKGDEDGARKRFERSLLTGNETQALKVSTEADLDLDRALGIAATFGSQRVVAALLDRGAKPSSRMQDEHPAFCVLDGAMDLPEKADRPERAGALRARLEILSALAKSGNELPIRRRRPGQTQKRASICSCD